MANQRQSSDRGCTQRGAYRRDFVLKVSQVVKASGLLLALFASTNAGAQSFTANTLAVSLTQPAEGGICSVASGTNFAFAVSGSYTVSAGGITPSIKLYASQLENAGSGFTCPNAPSGTALGEVLRSATTSPQSFPVSLTQTDFSNPNTATGDLYNTICGTATTQTYGLCIYVVNSTSPSTDYLKSSSPPRFLNTPSSTPTTSPDISISNPLGGDELITFSVTAHAPYDFFNICYTTINQAALATTTDCSEANLFLATTSSGSSSGTTSSPSTSTAVWTQRNGGGGLANGTNYHFKVQGPGAGTTWSNVLNATPVDGKTALELYNGSDQGLSFGCDQTNAASSPSAILGLAALLAVAFCLSPSRRRRLSHSLAKIALGAMLMTMSSVSLADSGQVTLGLIGSPYKPNIDANAEFPVYKCLFRDATLPLIGGQFDFHVADPFGSIRVGFAAGYTWANGNAYTGPTDTCDTSFLAPGIPVGFQSIQLRPRITYVFDPYLNNFPFAPFARLGVVGAGYYFTYQGNPDTGGQLTGVKPAGIRFGWEATGGVVFMLDSLEPRVAARARASGVYSHSYLSFEVAYSSVNDFGTTGLDLSPAGMAGSNVPLLITLGLVVELQ